MTTDQLREKFLEFFKSKNHKVVESDSLVPKDDPTVLFTPAGMNQFKKEFLGFDAGYKRATTSQRCLRTDDLDKVGKTSVHHTFFEMLGNFSFGDYFKKEAISWAWEFLTQELKIPADKLWVSVYQDDDEAYNIWRDVIKIPEQKILRLGDKDNFWPAEAKTKGPNGPCGPCSEIFYDFGSDIGCKEKACDPTCSCGRFAEIWNLVFTQFDRKEGGSLDPLPNKNIDTGMGLERLAAVMQGKQNNFQTDLFEPIIKEIERKSQVTSHRSQVKNYKESLYAIADHIRAVVFSIYDGIIPSNEGRGYVVRKIIRKASLHLISLGIKEPFLHRLAAVVIGVMRKSYPELISRQEEIVKIILAEERSFVNALGSSEVLFNNKFTEFIEKPDSEAVGNIAFLLHDTYGIPLDVTREWLGEHKISFSQKAFEKAMEEQRERSKSGSSMKGDVFGVPKFVVEGVQKTQFIGYNQFETEAKIIKRIEDCDHPDRTGIILDKTVFYAESGGQVNDVGTLTFPNGETFSVINIQKVNDVFVHWVKNPVSNYGNAVNAKIDVSYRMNVARNHTATHLLQASLREVLGSHVKQQGSLVTEEKLRFDFTHFKGLSKEEIVRIEELANSYVNKDCAVVSKEMALKDAKGEGALAFFEEKYAEIVRMVSIGNISKELCGGTHISNIKEIGLIKIISESSVASGIRRIEAVTAKFAEQFIKEQEQRTVEEFAKKSKFEELKAQEKKREAEMGSILQGRALELMAKSVKINEVNAVFSIEDNLGMQALRLLVDMIKVKLSQVVVVLGSAQGERAFLVIGVSDGLCSKGIDAGQLTREVSGLIGGSGGGRKEFAQAGGTKPENFTLAFEKLKDIIKK